MLTITYIALAAIGCFYVVVSAFTGHLTDFGDSGHAGHGDAGSHTAASHYGVDGTGHGSVSAGDMGPAAFQFPFFSPLALATLFAAIGGYGLIAQFGFRVGEGTSLVFAIPAAVVTAYGITYGAWMLVSGSRGGSEIRLADLPGAPAEVITPIPAGGIGEVAAMVGPQRYTAPAREADGKEVPRGAQVTVVRMVGTTLVVRVDGGKQGGSSHV